MKREINSVIPALDTEDGAGVKLRRSLGANQSLRHDPFLLLDEILSDEASDYIGGFPAHPHRGFETVTYMLDGSMQHQDHMGNIGLLKPGGAQWMTAGRGIIHSEMPQQDQGRLHGFQLWINLAAKEKMLPAYYRDISPEDITEAHFDGGKVRLIAGQLAVTGQPMQGPINSAEQPVSTDPILADVMLEPGAEVELPIKPEHNALIYLFEGEVTINQQTLQAPVAATLSNGDTLALQSSQGARLLVLAARPIAEPIVQRGPFVMNTTDEIRQAMHDYGNGTLAEA